MASKSTRPKLLVIVGPTASGKSSLAMKVAALGKSEIIAADSRTVYRGMDIGTAKPSRADQVKVKHWGLDLVDPGQRFTVADFKKCAEDAITDIQGRGRLPILVGGTGLYIDSVVFNFSFRPSNRLCDRTIYLKKTVGELQEIIEKKGYKMPENKQNKRHLIRVIEAKGQKGGRTSSLDPGIILIGLMPSDSEIKSSIQARLEKSFRSLATETEELLEKYGKDRLMSTAGIPYKASARFIEGEIDEARTKELIKNSEWQYVRRQRTWLKRNPFIEWFDSPETAYESLRKIL